MRESSSQGGKLLFNRNLLQPKKTEQLSILPGVDVPASSPQGEKAKSYISDSTGLS